MGASRERIILTTAAGLAFVGLASLGLTVASGTSERNTAATVSVETTTIVEAETAANTTAESVARTPAEHVTTAQTDIFTVPAIAPTVSKTAPTVSKTAPTVPLTELAQSSTVVVTATPTTLGRYSVKCSKETAVAVVLKNASDRTLGDWNDPHWPCKLDPKLLQALPDPTLVLGVYPTLTAACDFKRESTRFDVLYDLSKPQFPLDDSTCPT